MPGRSATPLVGGSAGSVRRNNVGLRRRLTRRIEAEGKLTGARWPMHTGRLEGINKRIKVIKRMAFGYRDTEMSSLKIQAAFPGHP